MTRLGCPRWAGGTCRHRPRRFLTPDVSGRVSPGAPQSLNRYAYAGNDPINLVDHTGKSPAEAPEWGWSTYYNADTGQVTYAIDLGVVAFTYTPESGEAPGRFNIEPEVPVVLPNGDVVSVGVFAGVSFSDGRVNGFQAGVAGSVAVPWAVTGAGADAGVYFTSNREGLQVHTEVNYSSNVLSNFGRTETVYQSEDIPFVKNIYPNQNNDPQNGSPFEAAQGAGDSLSGMDRGGMLTCGDPNGIPGLDSPVSGLFGATSMTDMFGGLTNLFDQTSQLNNSADSWLYSSNTSTMMGNGPLFNGDYLSSDPSLWDPYWSMFDLSYYSNTADTSTTSTTTTSSSSEITSP